MNSLVAAIGDTLKILESRPEFKFTTEHMLYLREFIRRNPAKIDAIKDLMNKHILECGGFFTGPTELTLGAEGLVRELYLGKRWLKTMLGINTSVVWNVDAPGHTLQLPQILAKAGIEFFVIWKDFSNYYVIYRKNFGGYEGPYLFNWSAPDGSKVTVCHTPGGYGGGSAGLRLGYQDFTERFKSFVESFQPHLKKYNLPDVLFVADGGDIQRPSLQIIENIRRWNQEVGEPKIKIYSTSEFFHKIEKYDLPASSGEMPCWWDEVQSWEENRVLRDRVLEGKLLAGEGFSSVAKLLNPTFEYPKDHIDILWEYRLISNEHNWGGTNGAVSDEIRVTQMKSALIMSSYVLDKALQMISSKIKLKEEGIPIVVLNPLAWDRRDVVRCKVKFKQRIEERIVGWGKWRRILKQETSDFNEVSLKNHQGDLVPLQLIKSSRNIDDTLRDVEIVFEATVPSFGYATYYLVPAKHSFPPTLIVGENSIENKFYKITVSPFGGISSIIDKRLNLEVFDSSKLLANELLAFEDLALDECEAFTGNMWRMRDYPSRVYVAENGPVRAVVRVEGEFLSSQYTQDIILYNNVDRIDLTTTLNWKGKKEVQVVSCYPISLTNSHLTYEVPFGCVEYGTEHPNWVKIHPSVRGVRNWIEVWNEKYGVTLATQVIPNDFRDRTENPLSIFVIQPILLRTVFSCGDRNLYFTQEGTYEFRFALRSHEGSIKVDESVRFGWEHSNPLIPFIVEEKEGGSLPESMSFLRVEARNVIVSAIKGAEDGRGIILRCYETTGKSTTAKIEMFKPVSEALITNIIEEDIGELPIRNGTVELPISGYSIETVRLLFG